MTSDSTPLERDLSHLSDEAIVEIHTFLEDILRHFESRYAGEIHRFYEARSFQNIGLRRAPISDDNDDDPPF